MVDIIDEMLDECESSLKQLGVSRRDLVLINRMIEKRTCQADYVLELASRYTEPYELSSVLIKTLRHWDVFDNFLERAPALEPVAAPDRRAILDEHLANFGEGTHFYRSRDVMRLPSPAADRLVEELVDEGSLRIERSRDGGKLLTRTSR